VWRTLRIGRFVKRGKYLAASPKIKEPLCLPSWEGRASVKDPA